ncbi:hypothetical protein SAMN05444671_4303 [Flavobacterium sp. CF108]|uniref:HNH endonuclease n=1 Tax=Flavobacterium sp. CF108 TaxID=1882758 RepID=UPI000914B713|nr:hypothetical protein [Flavobacterium sp. CF108]SHH92382.1 hypothetical protein SAMN05444671_4303 [Flavobacterium sp. CF108]
MKNIREYDGSSKTVYLNAVSRKIDENLRTRLNGISLGLGNQYDIYDNNFNQSRLGVLQKNIGFNEISSDIRSLYDYKSVPIRELREAIEKNIPAAIRYTCQYCTLTPTESFDHYLPQEEFPEYVIHTNNLIPCCKTCNGFKSFVWRNFTGMRLFINLYRDPIPQQRFLFVEILDEGNGDIDFRYYLDNSAGIDNQTFGLLFTHFDRLRLEERMRKKAVGIISELENSILSSKLGLTDIIAEVKATAERNFASYGSNYWKSIAEIALVESPIFLARFLDQD